MAWVGKRRANCLASYALALATGSWGISSGWHRWYRNIGVEWLRSVGSLGTQGGGKRLHRAWSLRAAVKGAESRYLVCVGQIKAGKIVAIFNPYSTHLLRYA